MRAIKYLLITLLLLVGVSFLYAGMGINIPEVEYGNVTSYGAPLGSALIVLAVAIAGLWDERSSAGLDGR
jgi:hypothetical protein